MIAGIIIASVAVLLFIAWYVVGQVLAHVVMTPKTVSPEDMKKRMLEQGFYTQEMLDSINFEPFEVRSRYGYTLRGDILTRKPECVKEGEKLSDPKRIALMCHGYTANMQCSYGYADVFLKLGFTVVMYDHRNHGISDKAYTSMGYFEKYDMQTVADWIFERFGSDVRLVTHGESMGSANVLSFLAIDERPVVTVADCGYSSLPVLVSFLMKNYYKLPAKLFVPLARRIILRKAGFDINDVNPQDGVINTKKPILFIHGEKDSFVPTFMSRDMYALRHENTRLEIFEGADHAESYKSDKERYLRVVGEFLDEYYFNEGE